MTATSPSDLMNLPPFSSTKVIACRRTPRVRSQGSRVEGVACRVLGFGCTAVLEAYAMVVHTMVLPMHTLAHAGILPMHTLPMHTAMHTHLLYHALGDVRNRVELVAAYAQGQYRTCRSTRVGHEQHTLSQYWTLLSKAASSIRHVSTRLAIARA
eukprot:1707445-Rhodomonas_salina.1